MKRSLGIDFGDARIGLAISDDFGILAHPLETIHVKQTDALTRISDLVTQKHIKTIVIGMPRNMDGTYGPAAEKVKVFVEKLQEVVTCKIKPWDERLTTVAAQKSLQAAGRNTKQSRNVIDQAAAQLILQGWLDSQAMLGQT